MLTPANRAWLKTPNGQTYKRRGHRVAREKITSILREKKNQPCMDCGQVFPYYVMQYDHRDPTLKVMGVGSMTRRSIPAMLAEIDKCDLVCANCHAIRTWGRN